MAEASDVVVQSTTTTAQPNADAVVQTTTVPVVEAPALDETEQGAYKEGWRPKEEFSGPEGKWIPADEFMRRKPLFEKIDGLKSESFQTRKELQDLKKTLGALTEHHKKVREVEYKRALDDLKSAKAEAFENKDLQALQAIDDRMDEIKEDKREFDARAKQEQLVASRQNAGPTPEYQAWAKENDWYTKDRRLRGIADAIGQEYIQSNPQATPNDVFKYVTEEVKKTVPEKFTNQRANRPSAVDGGNPASQTAVRKDQIKLSPVEEEIARRFEENGVMTRDQYASELKKVR